MIAVDYYLKNDRSKKVGHKNSIMESDVPYQSDELVMLDNIYYRITSSNYDYEVWQISGDYYYTAYIEEATLEFRRLYKPKKSIIVIDSSEPRKSFTDQYGALYDDFGKTLVKGPKQSIQYYNVKPGTKKIKDNAFEKNNSLTMVDLPDSVEILGRAAFYGCINITTIKLSNSIKTLETVTFSGCKKLKSINIPLNLKRIEYGAFWECSSLLDIDIPNNLDYICLNAFNGSLWGKYNHLCEYKSKGKNKYKYFSKDTRAIKYPEGTIFVYLPSECPNLKKITIPTSVKVIDGLGLNTCPKLKSLIIPEGVEIIGKISSQWLEEVYIPASVCSIQNEAFKDCKRLKKVVFDEKCKLNISKNYFATSQYREYLTFPQSSYWDNFRGVFNGCTSLEVICLPENIDALADYMFYECSSLKYIAIPNSVKYIGENCFCRCTSLTHITLPDSVNNIRDGAFGGCLSLKNVIFNKSLYRIGRHAFIKCDQLKVITIPDCCVHEDAFDKGFGDLQMRYTDSNGYCKTLRYNISYYPDWSEIKQIIDSIPYRSCRTYYLAKDHQEFMKIQDYSKGRELLDSLIVIHKSMKNKEKISLKDKRLYEHYRFEEIMDFIQNKSQKKDLYKIQPPSRLPINFYKAMTYAQENNLYFVVKEDRNGLKFIFSEINS